MVIAPFSLAFDKCRGDDAGGWAGWALALKHTGCETVVLRGMCCVAYLQPRLVVVCTSVVDVGYVNITPTRPDDV